MFFCGKSSATNHFKYSSYKHNAMNQRNDLFYKAFDIVDHDFLTTKLLTVWCQWNSIVMNPIMYDWQIGDGICQCSCLI